MGEQICLSVSRVLGSIRLSDEKITRYSYDNATNVVSAFRQDFGLFALVKEVANALPAQWLMHLTDPNMRRASKDKS